MEAAKFVFSIPPDNGNTDGSSELSEEDGLRSTLFVVVHEGRDGHPIFARCRLPRQGFDDFVEVASRFSKRAGGDGDDLSPVEVGLGLLEWARHTRSAGPGCICREQAVELLELSCI